MSEAKYKPEFEAEKDTPYLADVYILYSIEISHQREWCHLNYTWYDFTIKYIFIMSNDE